MTTVESAVEKGEVAIDSEWDIVVARRTVRDIATKAGFGVTETTRIVTAASELARNIHKYAGKGVMHWMLLTKEDIEGIELRFEDQGPGIADIDSALTQGYTTGNGLGIGLPGAKRLMDEMEIRSEAGAGTAITVRKWRREYFQGRR